MAILHMQGVLQSLRWDINGSGNEKYKLFVKDQKYELKQCGNNFKFK